VFVPRARIRFGSAVPSLFYIRLIGFTAGTLVYLFLLALILGHRKPRLFERLLFFVCLSLFLVYSGGLLEINAFVEYGTPPIATRWTYTLLRCLGFAFLPGLLIQMHVGYLKSVRGLRVSKWLNAVTGLFYLAPFAMLTSAIAWGRPVPPITIRDGFYLLAIIGSVILIPGLLVVTPIELFVARTSKDLTESRISSWLFALSASTFVLLCWLMSLHVQPARLVSEGEMLRPTFTLGTAVVVLGAVPGALFAYYAIRRNFLGFGAQRNLMYALPATFLALLYLALVRRVGTWLEPVVPPEATASVLLFVLIFLFEPLERLIGPALHRRFQERMGAVQRLSSELQQEARQGSVSHLVAGAEKRIREEFGLASVRLTVPPDPAMKPLEAPGGLGHTASVRLTKDGEEIGLLETASTGSYLTGETTAALGFLGEQLPGMIDLARLIEDKLRLERELAERERMASLGQMAANVSHNLRNPLSSMKTVLQVQLENPDLPVDVRRDSTLVVNEIDRMSVKLSQLLRFAKPSVNGQRVAAVALANQTAVLFRHDAERRNVRVEFERPTEEIFALASEEALSEILSNLIVNAIEAQSSGGRVKVGLARNDERLEIIVEDGGPGISQELRAKIFQPYFTTKPTGTGLGLSIVARRVEEIGGTISCESPVRNGKGTRFRLTLPLAEGSGEAD
jgi:signal transduction histidine kinase